METGELSLDLVLSLDGAALEVRRIELLEALIELTGRPPPGGSSQSLKEKARAMVARREWVVQALAMIGLPTDRDVVRTRVAELRECERSWALRVEASSPEPRLIPGSFEVGVSRFELPTS